MENKRKRSFKTILIAVIPLLSFIAVAFGSAYAFYVIKVEVSGNENSEKMVLEAAKVVAMFETTDSIDAKNIMPGYSEELHFTITNTSDNPNTYGRYYLSWKIDKNEISDVNFVYTLEGTSRKGNNELSEDRTNKLIKVTTPTPIPDIGVRVGSNADWGIINTGVVHEYTLTVKLLDNGQNQNNLQGKEFNGRIVAKGA